MPTNTAVTQALKISTHHRVLRITWPALWLPSTQIITNKLNSPRDSINSTWAESYSTLVVSITTRSLRKRRTQVVADSIASLSNKSVMISTHSQWQFSRRMKSAHQALLSEGKRMQLSLSHGIQTMHQISLRCAQWIVHYSWKKSNICSELSSQIKVSQRESTTGKSSLIPGQRMSLKLVSVRVETSTSRQPSAITLSGMLSTVMGSWGTAMGPMDSHSETSSSRRKAFLASYLTCLKDS